MQKKDYDQLLTKQDMLDNLLPNMIYEHACNHCKSYKNKHNNYFGLTLKINLFEEYYFYLESNVGKQIGVQLSAVLNDSVELIRFNIK